MEQEYTVHSGDECNGDENYSVLKGPNGFECWLTEPEDRSWVRDGSAVVKKLNEYEAALTEKEAELAKLKQELSHWTFERYRQLEAELDRVVKEAVINAEATVQFLVNYEWGGILAWVVEGAPTRQEGIAQSKRLVTQRTRITMMHEIFLADSLVQSWRARQGKT